MQRLSKREITALENSYLRFEGAIGYGDVLQNTDDLLLTRGQGKGLKLYTHLLHDPHTYAEMRTLASTVISRELEVLPAGERRDEKKAADLVREQLLNLNTIDLNPKEENHSSVNGFDQVQQAFIISGVLHGYHCGEVMWRSEGSQTIASEIRSRDPRQFVFAKGDYGYVLRHRTQAEPFKGEDLPPKKILCFSNGGIDGNPYGFALGRVLFWPVFFKRNGIKFWLKFVERFASPKPTGKYPMGAGPQQKEALREALAALTQDSEVIIPDGMMVEYLEAAQSGTIDTYESLCKFMDAQISQAILGQTGTSDQTEGGGSRARDEVADDQKRDIAKAISDNLSWTFNRLAAWITEYNMPGVKPPKVWRAFHEEEDLNTRANRDKTLFDLGYRVNQDTVTAVYGEGYEQAEEETEEPALIAKLGIQGVQALTGVLQGSLPRENAVAVLVAVFGIDKKVAQKMVPEPQEPQEGEGDPLEQLFGGQGTDEAEAAAVGEEEAPEQDTDNPAFTEETETAFAEEDDPLEAVIDKARPQILAAIAPWIDTVGNFVANADTMEEIRDGLVDLYPQLDQVSFAEALSQAMQLSDLVGRDEVLEESEEDAEFAEALQAAIEGTLDFAAKKQSKGPNCTTGKSHFCRRPNGRGSCITVKKQCRYKPDGTVKTAADYTGKQKQYKNAAALDKAAGKAKKEGAGAGGKSEAPVDPTLAQKDIAYFGEAGSELPGTVNDGKELAFDAEITYEHNGKKLKGRRPIESNNSEISTDTYVIAGPASTTMGYALNGMSLDANAIKVTELSSIPRKMSQEELALAIEKMALHGAKDGDVVVVWVQNNGLPDALKERSIMFDNRYGGNNEAINDALGMRPVYMNFSNPDNLRQYAEAVTAFDAPGKESNMIMGVVRDGRLTKPTAEEIADGMLVRQMRQEQMSAAIFERSEMGSVDPVTGERDYFTPMDAGQRLANARAFEDRITALADPIEDRLVGRNPTPGSVRDYESFRQESVTWARSQGLDDTANGFDSDVTAAHDVGHPIVHEMVGLNSDGIRKAFGVKGNSLMAEEALVNVAEHLSRGDDFEASVTNGLRVVRVLTRNGTPEEQRAVRSVEFKKTLLRLSWNLYKNDNYSQYMGVLRQGVRRSGLVMQRGDDFNSTAS